MFETTPIGQSQKHTFVVGELNPDAQLHVSEIDFDRSSNSAGHFRLEKVMVGNKLVDKKDIVIPPGSALYITVSYSPLDLKTSKASYGGWETGRDERWLPKDPKEVEGEAANEKPLSAIHRSLFYVLYDEGREGMLTVQMSGEAVVGLNGEASVPRAGGPCEPGNGTACYKGKFSVDIPQLAPGGPKDMDLLGPVRFSIDGSTLELRMDDFPPAVMYLRSTEISQLPAGVVATLIVSGAEGYSAKGTFDGARITLSDVNFRVRVALGELKSEDVALGAAAMVDFNVPKLDITTTEPLSQGKITLRMETTLPQNPSGNAIFDQFLSNAKIVLIMKGEFGL